MKILFITNIISPYMHELFNHFSTYNEVEFMVAACAATEPDREWSLDYLKSAKYSYEILPDVKLLKAPGKTRYMYIGGTSLLKKIPQYDAIVFKGGTRFVGPFYALFARLIGKKTILWEENSIDTTDTAVKKIVKQLYINKNLFSGFIAYGTQVKNLIEKFNQGISDRVFFSYSPVNNDKFRSRYLKLAPKRALIRRKLGIPQDKKVLLFAGRFVQEKNLFTLISSIERIVKDGEKNILCLLIGGGELEKAFKSHIRASQLENFIKILPFMEYNKLSMFYSIADSFVLPSHREVWGLVVNEAMNFNLPVIVSDMVGCAPDLVKNNVNGYVFPHMNSGVLADCILKSLRNSEKFGINSYKIVQNANFDNVCKTIINSVT
jgi:glycosyltransferase involved in cell wall biosynthesis